MMFLDASVLVAIITREPEAESLANEIQRDPEPITSPVAVFEAALAISRKVKGGTRAARVDLTAFFETAGIRVGVYIRV